MVSGAIILHRELEDNHLVHWSFTPSGGGAYGRLRDYRVLHPW